MKPILILFLLTVSFTVQADIIKLRSGVWCPYVCKHGAKNPGYIIEAAQLIFKRAGHTLDYKTMNWSRSIREIRSGRFNGIVGAGRDEVPDFVFPSVEQGKFEFAFWAKLDQKWTYSGPNSLDAIRLGVNTGYEYGRELAPLIHSRPKNVQYATGFDPVMRNIRKLMASRVDVILVEKNVMKYTSQMMNCAEQIKKVGEIIPSSSVENDLFIAFSPNHPKSDEYSLILSEGWREIRRSGELAQILSKYGLKDWK